MNFCFQSYCTPFALYLSFFNMYVSARIRYMDPDPQSSWTRIQFGSVSGSTTLMVLFCAKRRLYETSLFPMVLVQSVDSTERWFLKTVYSTVQYGVRALYYSIHTQCKYLSDISLYKIIVYSILSHIIEHCTFKLFWQGDVLPFDVKESISSECKRTFCNVDNVHFDVL